MSRLMGQRQATESRSIAYRPDVDGLRAIAVLMVLLFHCGFARFAGGFVGVDVFFVISGYLITSLILTDLNKGTFSFYRFYARRIRRLLPALLVTVLLTLLTATIVMAPDHLEDAAKSGALATVSLSNFYFATAASYFDVSAQSKPFLHMWSLSLEEQFYLFWPAVLFLLRRWSRGWITASLVLLGIPVGLALSQYWIIRNPNHAYFLLPFRTFQFLMGAACIWLSHIDLRNSAVSKAMSICGLLVILLSALTFSDKTSFPGFAAAVPSLGAVLVIWQGGKFPLRLLLGNRAMVWFGRISYSTYLVHWPIVVFWLYLAVDPLSLSDKFLLLLLSLVAGQLLDSMVAQRFRYVQPRHAIRWLFTATQIAMMALVGIFWRITVDSRGLPNRFELVPRVARYRDATLFPFLRDYKDGILHINSSGTGRVLIFGDSMAQNYVPAILQLDGIRSAKVDIVSRGGCVLAMKAVLVNFGSPDRDCLDLRDHLYRIEGRYDLVIWSQNWLGYGSSLHWQLDDGRPVPAFAGSPTFEGWRDGIARTIAHFEGITKKVVVIGPPVTVDVNSIIQRIGPLTDVSAISERVDHIREAPLVGYESMEEQIRALVNASPNTLYIDPRTIICGDRACRFSSDGFSYYFDSLHNTTAAIPALQTGLNRAGLRL